MSKWKRYGSEPGTGPVMDKDELDVVTSILSGKSYVEMGEKYGISGPAMHKRFWKMIVNRPWRNTLPISSKDLDKLREAWNGFQVSIN